MEHMRFFGPSKKLAWLLIAILVVLSGAAYAYNILVYQGSEKVFWDALASNLSLSGVTCTVENDTDGQHSKQAISLNLIDKESARVRTTLTQNDSKVTTEDIDTKDADYIRYTAITQAKDKKLDTGNILNVWAKQPRQISGTTSVAGQTALGGCIVPLVNIDASKQAQLTAELKKGKIFQTDLKKSVWHWSWDEPYRDYTVTVQPVPYITFMGKVDAANGTKILQAVSPDSYKNKAPEKLVFRIGAASHRIEQISYKDKKQTFKFSNYGMVPDTTPPEHTISMAELQKRLSSLR